MRIVSIGSCGADELQKKHDHDRLATAKKRVRVADLNLVCIVATFAACYRVRTINTNPNCSPMSVASIV